MTRICSRPGCNKKTQKGDLCFYHRPKRPLKAGKHTSKDRQENKKFRESQRNHEGYLVCECCGSWAGSDADHIKGKGSSPGTRYDPDNKQILCRPCHDNKTNHKPCLHRGGII